MHMMKTNLQQIRPMKLLFSRSRRLYGKDYHDCG
jgi:hypothetical protein